MRTKLMLSVTAGLAVILSQGVSHQALAAGAALTGQVSSAEEGNMEGVVVSAKKPGSTVTVSVTTDAQGRYTLPGGPAGAGPVQPRHPRRRLRHRGADHRDGRRRSSATADLKLSKTKNLASQLTNAEWMMSIPGTEDQKAQLLNCTSCHTLERIVRSTHDADEFTQVITRMAGYGAVSQPIKPQRMLDTDAVRHARAVPQDGRLSRHHQSEHDRQVGVRPQDAAAPDRPRPPRAIVTEYDDAAADDRAA